MAKRPEELAAMQLASAQQQDNTPATAGGSKAPALRLGQVNIEETPEEMATGETPVMRIAYGVGGLAEAGHPVGTIVLGDYVLAKKGVPLTVYVLGCNRYYKENTDYVPGMKMEAMRLPTLKAVQALGKTTDWTDGPNGARRKPDFSPAADFLLLLKQPDGSTLPYFPLRAKGGQYGIVRFYADKNAYRFAGDAMVKCVNGAPTPYSLEFELTSVSKQLGKQPTPVPMAVVKGPTSLELIDMIEHALAAQAST